MANQLIGWTSTRNRSDDPGSRDIRVSCTVPAYSYSTSYPTIRLSSRRVSTTSQCSTHSLCRWCRRLWIWRSPGLRLVSSRRLHPLAYYASYDRGRAQWHHRRRHQQRAHAMITMTIPSASVLSFLPAVALWGHHLDILDNRHHRHDVRLDVFTCLANAWLLTIIITIAVSVLMSLSSAYVIR